jgi:hypothetical protein
MAALPALGNTSVVCAEAGAPQASVKHVAVQIERSNRIENPESALKY